QQFGIEGTATSFRFCIFYILKIMIDRYHDGIRLLQEFSSFIAQTNDSIIFNILYDKVVQKRLPKDRVPEVIIMIFTLAEYRQCVVAKHHDLVVLISNQDVDDVINREAF